MKVLLIGGGAREHIIAETLKKSPHGVSLFAYAKNKNPGILGLADEYEIGDVTDLNHIKEFATKVKPDFCVIGPEDPISAGVADTLKEIEIPCASPFKSAGQLESSKSFTRDLLKEFNIEGNPFFQVFTSMDGMKETMEKLEGNYVVKADGLMAGKGVKVSGEHLATIDEGLQFAEECIKKFGRVVIEEKLIGQEFSLLSYTDGFSTVDMPAVQDHKRAFDGDMGPNTGGMGTYSDANLSLPFLKPEDIVQASELNKKVIQALYKKIAQPFKGVLYGGFMATKNGVKLIEYNVRFGDPEAMNVLSVLKTDLVDICEAIIAGNLDKLAVEFENSATVCKYVVPEGYPDNAVKNVPVEVGNITNGAKLYFASVNQTDTGLMLAGSRAIAVVAKGQSIFEAERIVSEAIQQIKGPVFYRKDIGTKELIEKRIESMKELRK